MPPFVGAVALQPIFGRGGSVNPILVDWFGFSIRDGPLGVAFGDSIQSFPLSLQGYLSDALPRGWNSA